MAQTLKLEVVTPDRKVLSEEVEYIGVPGIEGEFGVLPQHVPFLSALGVGILHYQQNGKRYALFISGGFAEVNANSLSVLAEVAEKAEDIDVMRARKAQERAEKRLASRQENIDSIRAQLALSRAITRIRCSSLAKQE